MKWDGAAARDCLKRLARRLALPAGIIASVFGLQILASFNPHLVETFYSRGLYPRILRVVSLPANLSGFSVAEMLLLFLLAGLAASAAWQVRVLILRRRKPLDLLTSSLSSLFWFSAVAAALFMLVYGLNYQRPPLAESLRLEKREPDLQELETISRVIVEGVNRNYAESGAVSSGEYGSGLPLTRAQLFAVLEESFAAETLTRDLGAGVARVTPKHVYFSGVMSSLGVSGIYSPFTGEPNYNAVLPESDLPFTAAHEMAHRRGFARESEASFVAFLVCTKSSNAYVRYSGYLNALRVLAVLRLRAPERHTEVAALLAEGPRADLRASALFWQRHAGALSRLTRRVNNAYLKANRVRSGVRNYGEVVSLIFGYYLSQASPPESIHSSGNKD